nr:hypothetical protein [Candidatus Sigynarchaeota archaeon]
HVERFLAIKASDAKFIPTKEQLHTVISFFDEIFDFEDDTSYLHDDVDAWNGSSKLTIELPKSSVPMNMYMSDSFDTPKLMKLHVFEAASKLEQRSFRAHFVLLIFPKPLQEDAENVFDSVKKEIASLIEKVAKNITQVEYGLYSSRTGFQAIPDDLKSPKNPFIGRDKLEARALDRVK